MTTVQQVGTTYVPILDDDAAPAVPRGSLGRLSPEERFVAWGTWAAAFGLAWVMTQEILPLAGIPWFLIFFFACGLVMSGVTAAMQGRSVEVSDRVVGAVIVGGAVLVGAALVSTIGYIFYRGWEPLTHANFYLKDMSGVGPSDSFDKGGVLHALVGTVIELAIAVAITLPLGIGTAVFMTEVGGKFATVVRTVVEAMTALPSIVAGLFIYSVFIVALGYPRSGLAAGLALGVMMLPIIARAADVVLRVVPGGLREASLALGAGKWKTVWHVVLPTARSGLATALILGIARGAGETSPVLLTSGAAAFLVADPTDGVMNSLPLFIYTNVRSGQGAAEDRAFAAATVLLVLVLALFVIARLLARPRGNKPPLLSRLVPRRISGTTSTPEDRS
ncbi:phosphate ABC transporter permease PstA [Nocardioides sp. W7]|uniref:phosphate ABC transporter permease PstA n=1 Tax=Nocardioides sp. W7 TaxID=2931390 RepID=UPI001FD1EC9B|nr:phosphate ABC transporter permease PstA [Nocardioides sp. W7]